MNLSPGKSKLLLIFVCMHGLHIYRMSNIHNLIVFFYHNMGHKYFALPWLALPLQHHTAMIVLCMYLLFSFYFQRLKSVCDSLVSDKEIIRMKLRKGVQTFKFSRVYNLPEMSL